MLIMLDLVSVELQRTKTHMGRQKIEPFVVLVKATVRKTNDVLACKIDELKQGLVAMLK